jgi:hypothetical protein
MPQLTDRQTAAELEAVENRLLSLEHQLKAALAEAHYDTALACGPVVASIASIRETVRGLSIRLDPTQLSTL